MTSLAPKTPGPWTTIDMKDSRGEPITAKLAAKMAKFCFKNAIKKGGGSKERYLAVTPADDHRKIICHVGNGPAGPANALLLAAAPDLLQALIGLVALCERQTDFNDDGDGLTLFHAKQAILKAKGFSEADVLCLLLKAAAEKK